MKIKNQNRLKDQSNVDGFLKKTHRPETKSKKYGAVEELAFLSTVGAEVGKMNHSRVFSRNMTNSFNAVLKTKTTEELQKPLPATGLPQPVAVVIDKVTLSHRTYQLVGITAPIRGEMTTIYAGMSPVQNHTAVGLAADSKEKVAAMIEPEQLLTR
jgi:lysozyme family protein